MKVRELIAALSKADPELEVCIFVDGYKGPDSVTKAAIYFGVHQVDSIKATRISSTDHYVGLGYPGAHYSIPPNLITGLNET